KNEYKKEGFEKFQQLKNEIAEHVTGFAHKREATDTIRDMLTGKLRNERQPPPMPMPRTPEELQALFESLIAAGKIPQEVLDRMAKGERFVLKVTPQGLVLGPAEGAPPAAAGEQGAAGAPPAEGGSAAAAAPPANANAPAPRPD